MSHSHHPKEPIPSAQQAHTATAAAAAAAAHPEATPQQQQQQQSDEPPNKKRAAVRQMSTITRKIIATTKAPAAIGPYSQAVLVDHTLYISGSLGLVPETGQFPSESVKAQTEQSLKNIGAILEAAGSSYDNVVKMTVLLADMNDFNTVNDIYKTFFKKNFPARCAYQVAALPKNARVEIEAIAVVGEVVDA